MKQKDVYKEIQGIVAKRPLLVVGSGASVDHGIPGMSELGKYLQDNVKSVVQGDQNWQKFKDCLSKGMGLEEALTDVNFEDDVLNEIKRETWKLISEKDREIFLKIAAGQQQKFLPMADLLTHIYEAAPQNVDVITTNYDRLIEYACDQANLQVSLGFDGLYLKKFVGNFSDKHCVNILKVHGSLDTFCNRDKESISIPILYYEDKDNKDDKDDKDDKDVLCGLTPEIIVPGSAKYKEILHGTQRELLAEADKRIKKAPAFLCIGYGFNDNHIQENIIRRMRVGVPVIVLTRTVSEAGWALLRQNAKRYICIEKDSDSDFTRISDNKETITISEKLWSIDGFMNIITCKEIDDEDS